jgi:hypothetical protein
MKMYQWSSTTFKLHFFLRVLNRCQTNYSSNKIFKDTILKEYRFNLDPEKLFKCRRQNPSFCELFVSGLHGAEPYLRN